ncbi:MAG: hypothetical protein JWO59_3091, partial [Chloroflexi bacterium]|nr:hypothetical protein [Chloroflexota bacterium]
MCQLPAPIAVGLSTYAKPPMVIAHLNSVSQRESQLVYRELMPP